MVSIRPVQVGLLCLLAQLQAHGAVAVRPTFQTPPIMPINGLIAIEEHVSTTIFNAAFSTPFVNNTNEILFGQSSYVTDVQGRLGAGGIAQRVADMDAANVALSIVSLVPPGIQGVFDTATAVSYASKVNDEFSSTYGQGPYASRFRFFCSVALQSVPDAVTELARCMKKPGAAGVFIGGYTNIGGVNNVSYLDESRYDPFWTAAAALNVPVYLHSRMPQPDQQVVYRNYEFMAGSTWGFSTEVAMEVIRIMLAGVFDKHPTLQIVVGHCGEGIPFSLYRMDQRMRHFNKSWGAQKSLQYYWENNIIVTTSGVQSDSAFYDMLRVTSPDRVLFSADYPFEAMDEMADWFSALDLNSKVKNGIGSGNAMSWYKISNTVPPQPPTSSSTQATSTQAPATTTKVVTSTITSTVKPTTTTKTTTTPTPTPTSSGTIYLCQNTDWALPCQNFDWSGGKCLSLTGTAYYHNFRSAGPSNGVCNLYASADCSGTMLWSVVNPGVTTFNTLNANFGSILCA